MAAESARADRAMARLMLEEYPDDAARLLETAKDADSAALLGRERPELSADILKRLTPDRAARVLAALPPKTFAAVVHLLNPSRVAALLGRLDEEERERCLDALGSPAAAELRSLSQYPRDTAGALMDPRATSFRPDATVRDVIRRLRRFRNRRIQDVFLVGEDGKLVGTVSLQDVVLASPETLLEALVHGPPVSVAAVASREEVIEAFETHRATSLAVLDIDGRLLGVLRQRELIKAARRRRPQVP